MKKGILLGAAALMMMCAAPAVSNASVGNNNTEASYNTDQEFENHFNNVWNTIEGQLESKAQNNQLTTANVKVEMTQLHNLLSNGYGFLKNQFVNNSALENQKMDVLTQRGELRSDLYKLTLEEHFSLSDVKQIIALYKNTL